MIWTWLTVSIAYVDKLYTTRNCIYSVFSEKLKAFKKSQLKHFQSFIFLKVTLFSQLTKFLLEIKIATYV